jgi:beta-fructofuranosidase
MMDRRSFVLSMTATAALVSTSKVRATQRPSSEIASKLAADPLRPQYHYVPIANWMNDPCGPIFWKGKYHMFVQHNPDGAYWGNMHWAHAVSDDMVHWRHLPIALAPTPGGPDATGCFTGSAVVYNGRVHMLYTGVRPSESQCLAIADDDTLTSFTKLPQPVIAAPPPGMQVNGFRDPAPWQQGDWWYLVLGSGIANEGGAALLYRSRNLREWEYVRIFAQRKEGPAGHADPSNPWEVWECPDFFPLGDRHVLICSVLGKGYWQSGRFDSVGMTFHPDKGGLLDYGEYYAPKTQLDRDGNRIMWGSISESRPEQEYKSAGWAQLMALPRVLTLAPDGGLRIDVAQNVDGLRTRPSRLSLTSDDSANLRAIAALEVENCCGEVLLKAKRSSGFFEISLSGSDASMDPWIRLKYDPLHRDQIMVDWKPVPLTLNPSDDLELRLHIDGSVLELIVNTQVAWSKRFYYTGPAPTARIHWSGATTSLTELSIWQMAPISSDRLTS